MALTLAQLNIVLKARGIKPTRKELAKLKKELKATEKQVKKTAKGMGLLSSAGAKVTIAFVAVALAVRRLISIGKDLIDSFRSQEQASARLTQALKNQGFFSEEAMNKLTGLASQLQRSTIFSDEQTISAQAMLASFKLNADQIVKMTPLMQDLATMTSKTTGAQADLESIAKLMGLALEGQAGRLKQAGISLSDYQTELIQASDRAGKFNILLEVMQQNAGGLAKAVGETATAAVQKLSNKWSDVKEVLGENLVTSDFFQDFIDGLDVIIDKSDELLEKRKESRAEEELEAKSLGILFSLFKEEHNLTKVRGEDIDKFNKVLAESLDKTKVSVIFMDDLKKAREADTIALEQSAIKEQASADAKKVSSAATLELINNIDTEIKILTAKDSAIVETIRINESHESSLKNVDAMVKKGTLSQEDAIIVEEKLNELKRERIRLLKEEAKATGELADALDLLSLKTFGQIGKVGAGGLGTGTFTQGGVTFDVFEGTREEKEAAGTTPTTDENIGSNV